MLGVLSDLAYGLYAWLTSLCCAVNCTTTTMKVNERNCKVVKLLAEGGFSFVYLVEDGKPHNRRLLADLKVCSKLQAQKDFMRPGW